MPSDECWEIRRVRVDDEIILDTLPPCIPEGFYDAVVLATKKALVFQTRWSIQFTFQIVEQGPYFGVELPGYANLGVERRIAKARACSKLASWCRLIAEKNGSRVDRISLKLFQHFLFRVEVLKVQRNSRQRELGERDQYSVVSNIKDIVGRIKRDE